MQEIEIPKKEKKNKMLTVPVTSTEHETIMQYCESNKIKLTTLIRFALKRTYQLDTY